MKIAHASDLHGKYEKLDAITDDVDLVLVTGDFFPNKTRGIAATEIGHQTRWFHYKRNSIVSRLRGKPVLWMPGNHDYVNLSDLLKSVAYPAFCDTVTTSGVTFMGKVFAGFREINRIEGEWNGEADNLTLVERCEETFSCNNGNGPDVLVTHAPPAGILDECDTDGHGTMANYGITVLATNLTYRPHNVTHHFFGHEHTMGGKQTEEMGIKFFNGACHCIVHDVTF